MNIHKLMENVLLHCELFLGQVLLFTTEGREAQELAEENLKGCFAKRKLEVRGVGRRGRCMSGERGRERGRERERERERTR